MKRLIVCLALCLMGTGRSFAADPTAYLRTSDGETYYVAVSVSSWRLSGGDVKDPAALLKKLSAGADPLSKYIYSKLSAPTLELIAEFAPVAPPKGKLQKALAADLNQILADPSFYSPSRFDGVTLRKETADLLAQNPHGEARASLNRMLLDDAYTVEIAQNSSLPPLWQGADVLKRIVASMFYKGRLVPITIEPPDKAGAGYDLKISFADQTILKDGLQDLQIAVLQYPISVDKTSGFSVAVGLEITSAFTLNFGNCVEGFPVEVALDPTLSEKTYGQKRLQDLKKHLEDALHDPKQKPTVQIQAQTWPEPVKWDIRSHMQFFGDAQRVVPCYLLAKDPPTGTFDIAFDYGANAPIELRHPFFKSGVENAGHALTPGSLDTGDVGARALEQNLDIGGQLSSSVVDEKETDANGTDVAVRKRENVGTLDLRLAPWLNVLGLPEPGTKTFTFLTPFLIDARVSTGKITKDTLSLNRIAMGPEFEIRHYTDPSTYPSYQRYIFGVKNASDRDFKQAEWKGTFEFQPVFSALNHPLKFRTKSIDPKLDPDPDHDTNDVPITIGFGQQVLPLVGVEMGKTYRNKHPFAAIEQMNFVRRFYFGTTINLDFTSYVQVSVKDILYVRGEAPQDRLHNYFLGTISTPFPSFNRSIGSTAYFAFERGGQPPFAKADVNTVKFGYRIQWDNWFGKRR